MTGAKEDIRWWYYQARKLRRLGWVDGWIGQWNIRKWFFPPVAFTVCFLLEHFIVDLTSDLCRFWNAPADEMFPRVVFDSMVKLCVCSFTWEVCLCEGLNPYQMAGHCTEETGYYASGKLSPLQFIFCFSRSAQGWPWFNFLAGPERSPLCQQSGLWWDWDWLEDVIDYFKGFIVCLGSFQYCRSFNAVRASILCIEILDQKSVMQPSPHIIYNYRLHNYVLICKVMK